MTLTPGTRLGPYDIVAPIGAGGMGEVYRATDSNLKRSVAIKVLPAAVAGDADRLARFQREAEVLAALNHPNIAAIYGLERTPAGTALVMELVEGEDLSAMIGALQNQGALRPQGLPLGDALSIAKQIAEALEAAHEHGIIHRDLKPANIKVRHDGTVKVLDFGLAKALAPSAASATADAMNSPTLTARATQMGTILGTAAYMSPEQAKGRVVDKRADIWAFGAVLFEMLSGQRAFRGEDISDTLAAVLRQDIDWAMLPASTPTALRGLITRCLERDPKRRLRDIGEARVALEAPAASAEPPSAVGITPPPTRQRPPFGLVHAVAAVLFVAVAVLSGLWWRSRGDTSTAMTSVTVALPRGVSQSLDLRPVIAISRDGSKIALVGNRKGIDQLYLRPMNEFEPRLIAGTEDASSPFFSPDGVSIGFFAGGKLKRVPAAGGPVITLAEAANDNRGAVWTEADTIIYTPAAAVGIYQVPAAGGTPTPVSTIDEARHERTHRWPAILPDGKTALVTIGNIEHPDDYDDATIEAIRLDTGARHTVLKGGRTARYVSSGHLVFLRGKLLFAVPFDAKAATVRGTPAPVIDGISGDVTTGSAHYAVSDNGTIVFVPGDPTGGDRRLVWMDAQGKAVPIDVPPAVYVDPHVAPDGRRVAVSVTTGNSVRDVYVIDTVRATTSRLTFGGADNRTPLWSHDGQRLLFVGYDRTRNVSTIMTKSADGTGQARAITEVAGQVYAEDLTRDDGTLLFSANSSTVRGAFEIFRVALQPGAKPVRIVGAPVSDVQNAALSPDGKWLAYYSTESARAEVYVQSFESGGSRVQVSTAGGNEPHWAPDGSALYYAQSDGLMMVPIERGPALSPGKPRMLFSGVTKPATDSSQTYHIAGKGDRFLMLRSGVDGAPAPEVRVILNWFTELRRLGGGK